MVSILDNGFEAGRAGESAALELGEIFHFWATGTIPHSLSNMMKINSPTSLQSISYRSRRRRPDVLRNVEQDWGRADISRNLGIYICAHTLSALRPPLSFCFSIKGGKSRDDLLERRRRCEAAAPQIKLFLLSKFGSLQKTSIAPGLIREGDGTKRNLFARLFAMADASNLGTNCTIQSVR